MESRKKREKQETGRESPSGPSQNPRTARRNASTSRRFDESQDPIGVSQRTASGLLHPETQASIHRRIRSAHGEERSQDYVEVIADLIDFFGEARATDIARRMGVTHVTVIKAIARLQRGGFVKTRPYRSIFLTETGRKLAEEARRRHAIVREFLIALGVKPTTAEVDAEGIEHHVSEETLEIFNKFVRQKKALGS